MNRVSELNRPLKRKETVKLGVEKGKRRVLMAGEKYPQIISDHAMQRCKERGFSPIWVRQQLTQRPFRQGVHEWVFPGNGTTIVYSDIKKKPGSGGSRRRLVITVYSDDEEAKAEWERIKREKGIVTYQ